MVFPWTSREFSLVKAIMAFIQGAFAINSSVEHMSNEKNLGWLGYIGN